MKYLGSKSRLAKDIIPIILKDQPTHRPYVEPFAGGMNTICEVPNTHLRIAADINPYLIAMWTAICDYNWAPPEYVDRDEYARVKQNPENYPDYYVGWVGFNCSYSGRFFQGFAGITNTRTGLQRNYQKEAQNAVQRQVKNLKVHSSFVVTTSPSNYPRSPALSTATRRTSKPQATGTGLTTKSSTRTCEISQPKATPSFSPSIKPRRTLLAYSKSKSSQHTQPTPPTRLLKSLPKSFSHARPNHTAHLRSCGLQTY